MKSSGYKNLLVSALSLCTALTMLTGCSTQENSKTEENENSISDETASEKSLHSIGLEGVDNARQLGGYIMSDGRKVKDGVLIRTGALYAATDEDVKKLQKFKVSRIFDLRYSSEIAMYPDVEISGASHSFYNIFNDKSFTSVTSDTVNQLYAVGVSSQMMYFEAAKNVNVQAERSEMYIRILTETDTQEILKNLFSELVEAAGKKETVLWHCQAGKDRCGTVSALILCALGADRETVLDDFELSNAYYEDSILPYQTKGQQLGLDTSASRCLNSIVGVERTYMEKALNLIDEEYGSVEIYLNDVLGVGEKELKTIRNAYLE